MAKKKPKTPSPPHPVTPSPPLPFIAEDLRPLAAWDEEILAELLDEMKDDSPELFGDLLLDRFFDDADDADAEEAEKAEEEDTDAKVGDLEYRIIITCAGEEDQARLLERFEKEGLECRALIS